MAQSVYDINDIARLSVAFAVSGVATDPTAVTGTVRKPDGTTTAYTVTTNQIVKDSTGNYHLDVACDQEGRWAYKLVGTGVATDTGQGTFVVNGDLTGTHKLYVSIDELKDALSLNSQTYANGDLYRACASASRAIDNKTGRFYYSETETRYYTPDRWDPALDIIDVQSVSSLTIDTAGTSTFSTTWVSGTDFDLEPFNATLTGRPYERIRIRSNSGRTWPSYQRSVKVIGTFGWASVPDPVNQYAIILASKLLKRTREAPFGVLSFGLDEPTAIRIARNDPDFELLLGNYVKTKPGA